MTIGSSTKSNRAKGSTDSFFIEKALIQRNYTHLHLCVFFISKFYHYYNCSYNTCSYMNCLLFFLQH